MSYSFCLNRNEMLTLSGLSILYQSVDLKKEGKLIKDGQQYISAVVNYLQRAKANGAEDFQRLVTSISPATNVASSKARHASDNSLHRSTFREHSIRVISPSSNQHARVQNRRSTLSEIALSDLRRHSSYGRSSVLWTPHGLSSYPYEQSVNISLGPSSQAVEAAPRSAPSNQVKPNLDYLSLGTTPAGSQPQSPVPGRSYHTPIFPGRSSSTSTVHQRTSSVTPSQWESLLNNLDSGQTNIYDAVYGGPAINLQLLKPQHTSTKSGSDWPSEEWDLAALNMDDFELGLGLGSGTAQSVLSLSEESLSSGDDFGTAEFPIESINSVENTGFLIGTVEGNVM